MKRFSIPFTPVPFIPTTFRRHLLCPRHTVITIFIVILILPWNITYGRPSIEVHYMNRKANDFAQILQFDSNTFMPRDAPITYFYKLVPFSNLNTYIKYMSENVCNHCLKCIKWGYRGICHNSGMVILKIYILI